MMYPVLPFARPRAARLGRTALLFWIAALSACGTEGRGGPAPAAFSDLQRHALHVGLDPDAPDEAALGRVVSARLTAGAKHVVVLDNVAPFVKVFDGAGRFKTAFMNTGRGPGEARRPSALAVSGDSLLLVAEGGQGISIFDMAGRLRSHALIPGMVTLAAVSSCAGEWLLYGPRFAASGRGTPTWLHRVRMDADGTPRVQSILPDSFGGMVSLGLPYGLVADGNGAVVRHTLGANRVVMRVPCGGGAPTVLHTAEAQPDPRVNKAGTRGITTSVAPGMRAPGGIASLPGGIVFGEKVNVGQDEDRLDLTLVAGGGNRTMSVAGDYVLQDSRPESGVLLSTSDPVPQVFLLRPAEFMRMFSVQ
jgi:hypothetical protein